jgi:hypothetical protein
MHEFDPYGKILEYRREKIIRERKRAFALAVFCVLTLVGIVWAVLFTLSHV